MQIEAHIIAWNEADTIHFTIKHYQKFCSKITIYDNYSDDGTPEIASKMGCEVKQFGIKGELNDREYKRLKDHCWKGSTANYVIVCDADEILYPPSQDAQNSGTIFKTQGFNIYSESMPVNDWSDIQTGVLDDNYSKLVFFNPQHIREINYQYGCHVAEPKGNLIWGSETLWLLHYRCVGGVQRMIDRHKQYKKRLSQINIRWKMGVHYLQSEAQKRADFEERLRKSVTLSEAITT